MPGHYPETTGPNDPTAPWNQCHEDSPGHRLEELQRLHLILGDSWEAWAWMNQQLHLLDMDKETSAAWNKVRLFLEAKGVEVGAELAEMEAL